MSPLGMDDWWHPSHAVDEGMRAVAEPAGVVDGITTIFVTPMKLELEMVGPWHVTQVVMPAWLILEFVNFAPLTTGVALMLEPDPTWQTSQDCEVGMWFEGRPTMEKFAAGIANEAAALPWHWAQFVVVLGA
jgi:hypothetical protein